MNGGSHDLFGKARGALGPPEGARERVAAALAAAALAPTQAPLPTAPPAPSATPGPSAGATTAGASAAAKVGGALVVLALAVGAAWLASRRGSEPGAASRTAASAATPSERASSAPPPSTATSEGPVAPTPSAEATSAAAPPAATSAPAQRAPAPSASEPGDSLAEEVALIKRAQSAMRAGDAAGALGLLDEHQKRFPRGALGPERSVLRIQALCALGRGGEARALFQRLEAASPASPHLGSLKQSCPALAP